MNQLLIPLLCLVGLWLTMFDATTLQPAQDARSHFSTEFYRRVVWDLEKSKESIVVSPATAQKLLATIYKGMEPTQADRMLFDFSVKHIDLNIFYEECYNETGTHDCGRSQHLKRRQYEELAVPIDKELVVNFFEKDLTDTKDFLQYENFIIAPTGFNPTNEYKEFAKRFSNTEVINDDSSEVEKIKAKFGDAYKASENVDIFSDIVVKIKLRNNVVVETKYYETDDLQYVVVPLENGLKLFATNAANPSEFDYFIGQIMGRRISVFEDYEKDHWKTEKVLINLPEIKFENINDLAVHFRAKATKGLLSSLKDDAKLSEGFVNWPEKGPKIEHIWQRVAVEVVTENKAEAEKVAHTKTFDANGKNFFYAIYNDKEYFLLGHYIGAK